MSMSEYDKAAKIIKAGTGKITVTAKHPLPTRTRAEELADELRERYSALAGCPADLGSSVALSCLIDVFAAQLAAMESQIESVCDELAYKADAEDDDDVEQPGLADSGLPGYGRPNWQPCTRLSDHVKISVTQEQPPVFGKAMLLGQVWERRYLPAEDREETDAEIRDRIAADLRAMPGVLSVEPTPGGLSVEQRTQLIERSERGFDKLLDAERQRAYRHHFPDDLVDREAFNRHTHPTSPGPTAPPAGFDLGIVALEAVPFDSAITHHPAPAGPCIDVSCGTCARCRAYRGE